MVRETIRSLPLSNPNYQLIACLVYHTRNRTAPMSTALEQLPPRESSTSPRPQGQQHRQRRPRQPNKDRILNAVKFINLLPDPLHHFEDGLRKVYSYDYTFNTFCKERWRGRTLLDIFSDEFRDRPVEYYVRIHPYLAPSLLFSFFPFFFFAAALLTDLDRGMPLRLVPSASVAQTNRPFLETLRDRD